MFVRGLKSLKSRGMAGLGEFVNVPRKVEYWLPQQIGGASASVIPGVSNTTAAVAAGGIGLAAAAALAWYFLRK